MLFHMIPATTTMLTFANSSFCYSDDSWCADGSPGMLNPPFALITLSFSLLCPSIHPFTHLPLTLIRHSISSDVTSLPSGSVAVSNTGYLHPEADTGLGNGGFSVREIPPQNPGIFHATMTCTAPRDATHDRGHVDLSIITNARRILSPYFGPSSWTVAIAISVSRDAHGKPRPPCTLEGKARDCNAHTPTCPLSSLGQVNTNFEGPGTGPAWGAAAAP